MYIEPEPIDTIIERDYNSAIEAAKSRRISCKQTYEKLYNELCSKFLELLPSGKDIKIRVIHERSTPANYEARRRASPTRYQMYAIEQFVYELKQKKYNASHREEVDYRKNPDPDDYYDHCDSYYIVEVKL